MRKAKHGVTEWQVDKAFPGYTIFAPQLISARQLEGKKESYVYLIDMKGDIVHHWAVPGMVKLHGELLENGNLLCSCQKRGAENPLGLAFAVSTVMELDWDSNVVWELEDPKHDCHDRCRLKNGNTLIMRYEVLDKEKEKLVKGGTPGTESNGVMYTLALIEVAPDGEEVDYMRLSDVLDPDIDVITPHATRELWPGLNSIQEMPDGKIVSTSYNCSMIYVWDRENKKVAWRYGHEKDRQISFPHDPQPLKNGNIMVFDNGRYYVADPNGRSNVFPPDFSRVLEIDPKTNETVWEYRADNPVDFYSTYISSSQRLRNGNTLICEGATGRIFEVTENKEIVWEYISPFYSSSGIRFGRTNCIFRSERYATNYPGLQGKEFDLEAQEKFNQLFGSKAMDFANRL